MPEEISDRSRPRCLILVPRRDDYSSPGILDTVQRSVEFAGADPVRFDIGGEYGGLISDIAAQIPKTIQASDAVIVDLTGSDPNVMYELGFAHALRKPVLPIIERGSGSVPTDLQGYLFYAYDQTNLDELEHTVRRWLKRALSGR